jgi:hypothetical protein
MHGKQPGYQWTTDAVILWPNGDRRSGRYMDGYGVIGGVDLVNEGGDDWRLVHQWCYAKVRHLSTEDLFASFHKDRHAGDQGWWPGERLAVERYGEPDLSELENEKEKSYVCYGCKSTWKAKWSGGVCPFGCERPAEFKSYKELVEPLRHLSYELEHADGLIVCHNTKDRRHDGVERPCFRFGEVQQARITKPDEWDEMAEDGFRDVSLPFKVRCLCCRSTEVEVIEVAERDLEPAE